MTGKNSKRLLITLLVVLGIVLVWGPVACASEPFIGEIRTFGFSWAPRGWALCQGQYLSISMYSTLYSLLGTTYGGDGRTNFALPDLRGRVAVHSGSGTGPGLSNRRLGERGGQETVVLSVNSLPAHSHVAVARGYSGSGNLEDPHDNVWAKKNRDDDYSDLLPNVDMNAAAISISNTGGSQPHENMQPWLAVNHIIALVGVFPSRN